jgi:AAA ATPase domain
MTSIRLDGPRSPSVDATVGQPLLGRDDECRRIARLLRDARAGRSGVLVLSGEPGIGKTALCGWAVAQARGLRVMSARGVESEVDLPFAGLAELCSGVLDQIARLPKPQARALDGALARRDATRADRFAIGAAVLSLFAVAGSGEPVLITVDDAQWLDGSSADAVLFAARRLRHESAGLLVATRPGSVFDNAGTGLRRLGLRGLDGAACRTLLRTVHGMLPDQVAAALAERSQGNPLALLELPRLLTDAQLAGEESIDEPLPLGPTLARALLQRQSGLPTRTRRALLVAAANSGDRVQPVIDALGAWGLERTVLDPAERAGVLAIRGARLEFRHPLLRSAIYHSATGPARRAAHAALASVTSGESQGWHLAQATVGEDETVAATLERMGLDARRRGALAAASAALERAARLSEPGARRASRLTEAAHDAHLAGRSASALRLLDDALFGVEDVMQRADIQRLRGRILVSRGQSEVAYRVLLEEATLIRDLDPARAATMLAEACLHCLLEVNLAGALAAAREAYSAATHAGLAVRAYTAVMLATALVFTGERVEATALLDRFLPLLRQADPLAEAGELVSVSAQCYFWLDRYLYSVRLGSTWLLVLEGSP